MSVQAYFEPAATLVIIAAEGISVQGLWEELFDVHFLVSVPQGGQGLKVWVLK